MITSKDYYEITNCTDVCGFNSPSFTIEEIQQFLINAGYKIIVHEAICTVHEVEMDCGGGVNKTGKTMQENRKAILAVKPGNKLPERIDSDEASNMNFLAVFKKEFKKKILGF